MRLAEYLFLRTILPLMLGAWYLLSLQACGTTESFSQADVLGSYLYVDEMNMAAGSSNQVHLACRRSNGRALAAVAVQVAASKAGAAPTMLAQDWLVADAQGKQLLSFSLPEAGMYTLALQLKLPGSDKIFQPERAYTVVQVLDEQAIGIANQIEQTQVSKPIQAIIRGTALNTQILLLDNQQLLQLQARKIRFQSSDSLAILPEPILLTAQEGGNKLVLRGTQLYTLGEQTILAIEDETSRIVSEQRYQITLGAKTVYRALLQKPLEPVVADGQALAKIQLTLTDGSGEPIKQIKVTLAIGQGSAIRSLSERTDSAGMATFAWSETIAGTKPIELFLQVASGMLPIKQDTILFAPGEPTQLRFISSPTIAVAGELLQPVPAVQVVDALGNVVPMQAIPVSLTLSGDGSLGMSNTPFAGETTTLLQAGAATFPDMAILQAGSNIQLIASAPGLLPASSPSFTVVPAEIAQLVFTQQPATGVVYGASNAVRVAVQDTFGNLAAENGIVISLSLSVGNGYQLNGPTLATTRDGVALLDAGLNRSGRGFAVIASAPGLRSATSQSFNVATGAPDSLLSQILLMPSGPVVANGEDHHTLEVQLRDGQNSPIPGFPVGITSPLGQVQVAYPLGATTDNNGMIRIELRSTLADEKTILVDMGAINRQLSPKPVFLPGAPARANLSLNQSTLILDGINALTIVGKLADIHGNLLPNTTYALSSSIPTDTILPSTGITDSQGRLTASWQGTLASVEPREFILQSGSYISLPTQAIFRPGPPSLLYSTLIVSPSSAIADGQSTALLQARIADAFNNPIPALQVLFSASGKSNLLPNALTYTDALGTAQANLRSIAPQDKHIEIKLGPITLQATAIFLPPPCIGTPVLSLDQGTESLSTGTYPSGVVSAYLNQDRIADLAVINSNSNTIGIFLGRSDGTFATQITYGTGGSPSALTTLDANRDGMTDLAVVNYTSNTLSIFLGRPDGTFADQITYGTGGSPRALTTLDANQDGITDLAVLNQGGNTLGIFLGHADGTFAAQITYGTGGSPSALTTLDANRDGLMDLAVVSASSNTLGLFLGRPGGTFAAQVIYAAAGGPYALTNLDANRDGIMDLAVVNNSGNNFGLFLGRPNGTFAAQITYRTGRFPTALTTLDINRDGMTDLAVVNFFSNTLSLFLGRPDGTFAEQIIYGTGSYPAALATLDANRDGMADVAVLNQGSNTMSLFLGRPDDTFAAQVTYGTGSSPIALITLDANRDGMADLAMLNSGNNTLSLFLGRPGGTFADQVTYGTGIYPIALTTLDTNRDGITDLAVVNYIGNTLGLFLGRADGTFAPQITYGTGSNPSALITLDADQDGLTDLAVVNHGSNTLGLFLGRADGSFTTQLTCGTGSDPWAITSVDADGDGLTDLAVVDIASDTIDLFLGRAGGTFAPQVTYGAGSSPRALTTLDANRDGLADLAVVNYNSNTLGLFLGRADGTFADQLSYPSARFPKGLRVLDINQDGLQDVFVYGAQSSLHLGTVGGSFLPAFIYNRPATDVVGGDFNQDYVPDIVMLAGDSLELIERLSCEP